MRTMKLNDLRDGSDADYVIRQVAAEVVSTLVTGHWDLSEPPVMRFEPKATPAGEAPLGMDLRTPADGGTVVQVWPETGETGPMARFCLPFMDTAVVVTLTLEQKPTEAERREHEAESAAQWADVTAGDQHLRDTEADLAADAASTERMARLGAHVAGVPDPDEVPGLTAIRDRSGTVDHYVRNEDRS